MPPHVDNSLWHSTAPAICSCRCHCVNRPRLYDSSTAAARLSSCFAVHPAPLTTVNIQPGVAEAMLTLLPYSVSGFCITAHCRERHTPTAKTSLTVRIGTQKRCSRPVTCSRSALCTAASRMPQTKAHPDLEDKSHWGLQDASRISTLGELVTVLVTIAWTASAHHAAVNFGQYDFTSHPLNAPSLIRRAMPSSPGDKSWKVSRLTSQV